MNTGDTIDGGAGTDTLSATLSGGLATSTITNVENLVLTDLAAGEVVFSTSSATYISGVQSVKYVQSAGDITLTRIVDAASVTLENVVDDVTITFADTVLAGTNDTFTLNVSGFVLAGDNGGENIDVGSVSDTDGDIETLVINATGAASDFNDLDSAFVEVSTVTVNGSAAVDFGATAAFTSLATFNSTASTGGMTLLLGADGVSGTTNTKTLTFGTGADSLDLGVLAPADIGVLTVDMGAGADTVDLDDYADTTMVISGGEGTDTLVSAAVITAANATTISGFETFELGANAGTQVMSDLATGNTFTTLTAGAATTTFTNVGAAVTTFNLKGGVATTAATLTKLIDGSADSLTVKATTADAGLTGDLSIDEIETVTFDSSAFNLVVAGDITSTDLTSVTLVGTNLITLGANGAKEFSSTKIATLNATGVTGTEAVNVFAINNTVAMTVTGPASTGTFTLDTGSGADIITAGSGILDVDAGAGDDTITGGALADVLEGDAGNDTITGGEGADYIGGGAGVDTITLTETTVLADEVELSVGAANYDKIIGFDVGGTTTDDNLSALQATFGWNATDGTTTVLLSTGTTLGAADAAADSNIITISTNVAGGTFAAFMAGTMTEATMEANVITALGLTGALDAAAVVMVLVDDGTHTGVFKFTGADAATDDAVDAAEIEIMGVLSGIADATSILVGDILFT